ncbi:LOW QUALITY PROTEIN: pentatricopeptide repeat-containing protein At5g41170, mitochondrial [Raphanus sativus]|uniref:LOW QUALITY PROTEIN: pentatricopeptide repeat-containing protein At5g41170, mitochondrial n=1 Tax=Raphanus sativus TaxID=3726 RepID=A0A6J0N3G9_RAPSA|nr:LOW QUALITY PROTEIN: pentatricopeptide repeat-containing protein At5g41170, mitochondrial [Raphanus sativus]
MATRFLHLHRHRMEKVDSGTTFYFSRLLSLSLSLWFRAFRDYRAILRNSLHFNEALDLFTRMLESHPLPSTVDFTKLLTAISNSKRFDLVIALCNHLETLGIPHDLYTCNLVMNCLSRSSRPHLASSFLGRMMKLGFSPDIITFTSLVSGFRNRPEDAMYIVNQMGIEPGVVMYTTLIESLCRNGLVDNAMDMLNRMENDGVRPDAVTYTSLVNGLCNSSRLSDAVRLLNDVDMMRRRINPDVIAFNALIDGFVKERKLLEARELYSEMIRISVAPHVFMVSRGVSPSIRTYNVLLHGLCLNGKLDKALLIFEDIQKRAIDVNIITYTIIIQGMCRAGKLKDAVDLFCSLPSKGMKPNVVTYSTMISALFREGFKLEAHVLFRKMKEDGFYKYR